MVEDLNKPATRKARRALAYTGLSLAILAAVAIVAGLPWQIRLPLVGLAVLFGPGVPLMLALTQLPAAKSVAAGIGLDVSLLLITGEVMVLVRVWQPDYMVGILLVASAIVSVLVLSRHPVPRHRAGHA
jgi:hypothetical protein